MSFVQGVCARETFSDFVKLWDNLLYEEIKLETYSMQQKGVEEVLFVGRETKGSKKGSKKVKKEVSSPGKEDFNKVKCFRCH